MTKHPDSAEIVRAPMQPLHAKPSISICASHLRASRTRLLLYGNVVCILRAARSFFAHHESGDFAMENTGNLSRLTSSLYLRLPSPDFALETHPPPGARGHASTSPHQLGPKRCTINRVHVTSHLRAWSTDDARALQNSTCDHVCCNYL